MTALYELSNEYQALMNQDEYTSDDLNRLEELHGTIIEKAISLACVIRNIQAECDAVNTALSSMKSRKEKLENKIDYLKHYLKEHLEKNNIKRVTDSPLFVISVRNNAAKVNVVDSKAIPEKYYNVETVKTLNKSLIKHDITEQQLKIPGVALKAETSLIIK